MACDGIQRLIDAAGVSVAVVLDQVGLYQTKPVGTVNRWQRLTNRRVAIRCPAMVCRHERLQKPHMATACGDGGHWPLDIPGGACAAQDNEERLCHFSPVAGNACLYPADCGGRQGAFALKDALARE